jgi:flagellar protein FliS
MNMRAHRAYAATQRETAVSSARPIDLVVMVYDRLLDHLRSAQLQMAAGNDPAESLTKALELINQGLGSCLDMARGGEIAQNLAAIYDWASRDILRARLRRDPQLIQGVIDAMQPLAQAWREHAGLETQAMPVPAAAMA